MAAKAGGLLIISSLKNSNYQLPGIAFVRSKWNTAHLNLPKPTDANYRRVVLYPDKYTVKPLETRNLGGRDELTGRVVQATVGGGIKFKYHWITWRREGPKEDVPPLEEKVIQIMECGCRTAHIALIGGGPKLKYILATVNMKAGDIIRTSEFIPKNPVFANEGDAYPLGALPIGTLVHCIERHPGAEHHYVHGAGASGTILRKVDNRVIVKLPSKMEVSLLPECMATVGQLSNVEHASTPLGSPNRLRELGWRPRSGLFKKKDGRFGRKIKPPPPVKIVNPDEKEKRIKIRLTHRGLNMEIFDRDVVPVE